MTATATTTTLSPTRRARVVGALALALGLSMVVQNAVVVGAPAYGDPIADVLAFHTQHASLVGIAVGLEALNVPLLLGFLVGLHGLVGRRGGAGADWSRLAMVAGAATAAGFALYAVLWDGTVLAAAGPAGSTGSGPAFELAWQLHAAAFALALPALAVTVVGAASAAHASRLTPPWQRLLAVAAAGLLLVAGTASLAVADGSALLFVGVPGYFAWIVWLLVTGARLVRARTAGGR